jgi:D-glycero-alpha-D-manno-heptose-7-phosphate kinase
MKIMIIGITPTRISFAGGGTDMPEYYNQNGGSVVSTTINRFTYAIIHPRYDNFFQAFSPDFQKHYSPTMFNKIKIKEGTEIASAITKYFDYQKGINIILCSDVPGGSGMGASSSLAVNLINVFSKITKTPMNKNKIAETAFHIGRNVLKWPIGKQDEYSAAHGGLNFIKFQKNKTVVTPISISNSSKKELD